MITYCNWMPFFFFSYPLTSVPSSGISSKFTSLWSPPRVAEGVWAPFLLGFRLLSATPITAYHTCSLVCPQPDGKPGLSPLHLCTPRLSTCSERMCAQDWMTKSPAWVSMSVIHVWLYACTHAHAYMFMYLSLYVYFKYSLLWLGH